MTDASTAISWGRVLICGGTDWASNGRKDKQYDDDYQLREPHTIRSVLHRNITKMITGPAAGYAIVIDGPPSSVVTTSESLTITPRSVGAAKHIKFIGGAAARSHALLVGSDGNVWGCGNNVVGQIGLAPKQEYGVFTKISGPWTKDGAKVIQVSAGHTFSLFLTDSGQVYAAGSSEGGQLGNGKTGERLLKGGKTGFDIEVPARLVQGLGGKKIVKIASGNQHSLALDSEGAVYAWGYAGYCRLGLGDQKDRGAFYIAGRWKLTGEGSSGSAYTTFKKIQNLMGLTTIAASVGGSTHFITSPTQDGVMTVGFGQGCLYGELGLGSDVRSATKPTRLESLNGVDVIDIAAGAYFTLFLARPNPELAEKPRWPEHVESADICLKCNIDKDDDDNPLECERCEMPYHLGCLDPPLSAIPEDAWYCPKCVADSSAEPNLETDDEDEAEDEVEEVEAIDAAVEDAEPADRKRPAEEAAEGSAKKKRL